MKQLYSTLQLTLLLSMAGFTASAHDIALTNADGDLIYYVWTNDNTELSVSYEGSSTSFSNEYSGNLVIPESVTYHGTTYQVTSIGSSAFRGCTGLISVTIPNSVTSIGGNAFYECKGLTSVNIGNNVTSIGHHAFYKCSGITSVTIPNSVITIDSQAFQDCTGLISVTIPNSVTSIGSSAFNGCKGLTSVNIGNNVTSIESSTFRSCSNLTTVIIPKSVTSINEYAFDFCSNLTEVYCYAESVPSISKNAFNYSGYESATLYVPAISIDNYMAIEPWKSFGSIAELPMPQCAKPTITFANGELTFECETEGVGFVYNISMTGGEQSSTGNKIVLDNMTPAYLVAVYATKEGYRNSDVAIMNFNYAPQKGDVNGDGQITIVDVVSIVNIILGKKL